MMQNPFASFRIFRKRSMFLFFGSIATFFIGFIAIYLADMKMLPVFSVESGLILLTIATFSFGFLFFGFLTPMIMFFMGFHIGFIFKFSLKPMPFIIAAMACILLAAYASTRLGDALLDDLRSKGNFRVAWKATTVVLLIALVLAFSLDFTFAA